MISWRKVVLWLRAAWPFRLVRFDVDTVYISLPTHPVIELLDLLEADAALVKQWSGRVETFYPDWEIVRKTHAALPPDDRIDRFSLLAAVGDVYLAREEHLPTGDRWRMLIALCTHQVKLPVVPDEEAA